MTNGQMIKGWVVALFCVCILFGINNNVLGYAAKVLEVNYLVYCCCAFISAALVLIGFGGLKDDLAKETIRSPQTFVFGLLMLIVSIITLALFNHITATEGAFLQRLNMVFALSMAWLFMQRKPTIHQLIGNFIVLIGVIFMLYNMPTDNLGVVLALLFLLVFTQTVRVFLS